MQLSRQEKITCPVVSPIHLGWLRCSSLTYSSMLASHALPAKQPSDSWWTTYFFLTPKRDDDADR